MENKTEENAQSHRARVRGQGVPIESSGASGQAQPQRGAPMEVPGAPSGSETVNLTKRELLIYQAGQSFGAAQALRQVAEQVNKLSQTMNSQASAQGVAGQEFLDRALAGNSPKKNGGQQSGKLGRRLAKAVVALVGVEESE